MTGTAESKSIFAPPKTKQPVPCGTGCVKYRVRLRQNDSEYAALNTGLPTAALLRTRGVVPSL